MTCALLPAMETCAIFFLKIFNKAGGFKRILIEEPLSFSTFKKNHDQVENKTKNNTHIERFCQLSRRCRKREDLYSSTPYTLFYQPGHSSKGTPKCQQRGCHVL